MQRYRLGFDIGGTFTDFALVDLQSGALHVHKCLTTPDNPAAGALAGLRALLERAAIAAAEIDIVVHGTTLVANTLIERTGAKVGLVTSLGYRDTLEIRNEQRYDIYDLFLQYPEPLAPRHLRLGVRERCDRDGRVLVRPDAIVVGNVAPPWLPSFPPSAARRSRPPARRAGGAPVPLTPQTGRCVPKAPRSTSQIWPSVAPAWNASLKA